MRTRKTCILLVAVMIASVFAVAVPVNVSAEPNIINVPGDYPTIQEGIDAAVWGDTVLVAPGTYYESIVMKEGVIIQGSGSSNTIIHGSHSPTVTGANDGIISDFKITTNIHITLISCPSTSPTIQNCKLEGGGNGISCHDSSPIIKNNTISDANTRGIYCSGYSSPIIDNNTITGNLIGIDCRYGASPTITNNIVRDNRLQGINCYVSSSGIILNNIITGNRYGIDCFYYSSPVITNNIISGGVGTARGIEALYSSSPIITNNIITQTNIGINNSNSNPVLDYNNIWSCGTNYHNCSAGPNDISIDPLYTSIPYYSSIDTASLNSYIPYGFTTVDQTEFWLTDETNLISHLNSDGDLIESYDLTSLGIRETYGITTVDGSEFWVVALSDVYDNMLYHLNSSFEVIESINCASFGSDFTTDITTVDGSEFWVIDRWSYEDVYHLDNNYTLIEKFNTASFLNEQRGITTVDGTEFWISNDYGIHHVNAEFELIELIDLPPIDIEGIETINGKELWVIHQDTEEVYLLDPDEFLRSSEYHIQSTSPCIDAGTNDAPNLPELDIEGSPRILDGDGDGNATVDMGAYEYNPLIINVPSDYPTIQEAIDAATWGNTVKVSPGTYYEIITMKEGIIIQGSGANVTTINGDIGPGYEWETVIGANYSTITGFNIIGERYTIYCYEASPIIDSNIIFSPNDAIDLNHYSSPIITNNIITGMSDVGVKTYYHCSPTISNNIITGRHWGIELYLYSSPIISNNIISGDELAGIGCELYCSPVIINNIIIDSEEAGILCQKYSSPTITNNAIYGNGLETSYIEECGGIGCVEYCSPEITNNIITGNLYGIWSDSGSTPIIGYNDIWDNVEYNYFGCEAGIGDISVDPLYVDPAAENFHLQANSPCIDAGINNAPNLPEKDFEDNSRIIDGDFDGDAVVDMGAYEYNPLIINVPCDYPTIQEGIDAATWGNTVLVAPGTYYEIIAMKEGVTIQGSGYDVTTINGDIGPGWEEEIVFGANYSTIAGFTITGGDPTIYCDGTSPKIDNNVIISPGDAINLRYSSATITNNSITGMDDVCVECDYYCSATISNNVITGDTWGIELDYSCSPLITNNIITSNFCGIGCEQYSSPVIANNVIIDNTYIGIFCEEYSSPTITNNVINGNGWGWIDPEDCGGIYCYEYCSPNITNNIITGNVHGIYSKHYSSPIMGYNDVWDNGEGEEDNYEGCEAGIGDISADPLFVNSSAENFHLQSGSPCIDSGTNNALGLPVKDFHGNPRVIDGDSDGNASVDMGAFELNTPVGDDVHVMLDSGVTVTFTEVTGSGYTTVTLSETGPEPPLGFELLGVYYDISTTSDYTGYITVSIEYDDTGLSPEEEEDITLLHWNETAEIWEDVTDDGYPDTENNIIQCTVTELSLFAVMIYLNQPPVANAGGPYVEYEGTGINFNAALSSDPDGDPLEYRWDFENDGTWDTEYSQDPISSFTWYDDHVGSAVVEVNDGSLTATDTTMVTVLNADPIITLITSPIDPNQVNTIVEVSGNFTDPGTLDTHTVLIDWDDETSSWGNVSEVGGSGSFTGSHIYETPGVYTVTVTIFDDEDGNSSTTTDYIVIYDPDGGFVTGGGWIDSPPGAFPDDPLLTGKASFGFVSKYKNGATVPTGNTEFQFKAANLNFHSDEYDWLVIAGDRAIFKGTGTINGEGNYKFKLWAIDGDQPEGDGVDKFRMKIWLEDDGGEEVIIYDNGMETPLGGGQIMIHKG